MNTRTICLSVLSKFKRLHKSDFSSIKWRRLFRQRNN